MEYFEELKQAILEEDFYLTNELLSKIEEQGDGFEYIKHLLNIMEKNPNIDYGMPGPVVHFMEKHYRNGYEELLKESIKKTPTCQTLWMLNRIINDPMLKNKSEYIEILVSIAQKQELPQIVRETAEEFYLFQMQH